ncbi:hypothetical protein E3N88_12930 [Mikania micrantha]|uniref:Integrase catalytic domain-containing protein n=1 Tax=Mikania micrantha TaxID=192012 RepID=A0A5N6P6Z5_9ASTR|nr:hypothetical protein E3N88_12930 [Mikania micrantha]
MIYEEELGLLISTAYHPQIDGQSERNIQTLEDRLRACIINFGGSWDDYLPLAEFSYDNSYHSSIGMPPYEMLYGWKCPRIGDVAYRLELPKELNGIQDTFHVSYLRKCLADESAYVPLEDLEIDDKLNYVEKPVAILDRKVKHLRNKSFNQCVKNDERGRKPCAKRSSYAPGFAKRRLTQNWKKPPWGDHLGSIKTHPIRLFLVPRRPRTHFYHPNSILKPFEAIDRTTDRVFKP